MEDISIYIHIPFCTSKCHYCDFASFPGKFHLVEDYIKSLIIELDSYKDRLKNYKVRTIFIGGGTPSAIDGKYIYRILEHIQKNFNIHRQMEVSLEANPKTLDGEKLKIYREAGINRISLGLQTLNDGILKKLGRSHDKKDFFHSYDLLEAVGFENINVDLIFNLPDQTLEDGIKDVTSLVQLGIKHISYYSLIIEPNTPIYNWYHDGKIKLLDEDDERRLYHQVRAYLREKGYNHYEISNFAYNGYECKHNLVYWKVKPYIGLGLASHSYFNNRRFSNTTDLKEYIQTLSSNSLPIVEEEYIDKKLEIAEYCILGLRLIRGIDKREFTDRFKFNIKDIYGEIIEKHKKNGLVVEDERTLRLSDKGLDLANLVEVDFLPD